MSGASLPLGWSARALSACGTWISGGTPSKSNADYWNGDIPWISSKEVRSFELSDSELHVTPLGAEHGASLVPAGTVLCVVRGMSLANEFRVGVTTRAATFNQDVKGIVPNTDVDARYLARCLLWQEPQILAKTEESSHGTKRLPTQALESLTILLPPIAEQRRIAAILDKADGIRRKRREAIALTEELLRMTFLEMFGDPVTNPKGWREHPLGETFASNPRIGTLIPAGQVGEHLVVRVGELGDYDVALDRSKRATLAAAEFERFGLTAGDVVLARAIGSEDHLGKASVLQHVSEEVAFDSHVMRLRFAPSKMRPYFFLQWLRSPGGRARFMREAGRTAVQFNVNAKQIARVAIPLPPIEEQDRFVRFFDRTRAMMKKQAAARDEADALFASLVHRAFRGELSRDAGTGKGQLELFDKEKC